MRARSLKGGCEWQAFHAFVVSSKKLIGPVLYPARYVSVRGTAVRRVVLEAPILGRVVRWRDHDAVRQVLLAGAVIDEDRARNNGGWRDAVFPLNYSLHVVCRKN